MTVVRTRVLYSGRVQGVGFRWRSLEALRDLALRGFVRNLHDGRVELLLQDEDGRVDEALGRIERELGGLIRGTERRDEDPGEDPGPFRIER
ncbi:MAG: acylphosphatase [Planctomycetota bacterium]